jgi:hypothetical protein
MSNEQLKKSCEIVQRRMQNLPEVLCVGIAGNRIVVKLKSSASKKLIPRKIENIEFDIITGE